jgi:hypothetical protein
VGGLTPTTNSTAPIRHPLPDFSKELSGTPVISDPDSTTVSRATALHFLSAPSADKLLDQTDREHPDQWWQASNGSGASATSSVA